MVTWNDQADAKLLVSVLHTSTPKIDYAAVAKLMGEDVTICAIKHRIQRLKDKVNAPAAGTPKSPAKSLAKKRGRPTKAKDDAKDVDKTDEPAAKKAKANGDAADGEAGTS